MLIDYFTFSLRPSLQSQRIIHIEDIAECLGISSLLREFYLCDHGRARFYDHCFSYKGITFYTTDYERGVSSASQAFSKFLNQGISVEIKGEGCSFLENRPVDSSIWRRLFSFIVSWSKRYDYKVNVSRFDFAFDDFVRKSHGREPLLDLQIISSLPLSSEDSEADGFCVTSCRSKKVIKEKCYIKRYDSDDDKFYNEPAEGMTIYFGSRDSDCYARFYDKLVEQSVSHSNDPIYLRDVLGKYKSWNRFEIVFKNKAAVSLMLFYLFHDDKQFSAFLSSVINGFIRFCVNDDSNVSRCTMYLWWSDFMMSVEHSRISRHPLFRNVFNRTVQWLSHSVATSACAVMDKMGEQFLIQLFRDCKSPYRQKHVDLIACDAAEPHYLSYEELQSLNPEVDV